MATKRIGHSIDLAIRKKPDFHFSAFFLVPSGDSPIRIPPSRLAISKTSLMVFLASSLLTGIPPKLFNKRVTPYLKIECLPSQ